MGTGSQKIWKGSCHGGGPRMLFQPALCLPYQYIEPMFVFQQIGRKHEIIFLLTFSFLQVEGSGVSQCEFMSQLYHLYAVWPWIIYWTPPRLRFRICKWEHWHHRLTWMIRLTIQSITKPFYSRARTYRQKSCYDTPVMACVRETGGGAHRKSSQWQSRNSLSNKIN